MRTCARVSVFLAPLAAGVALAIAWPGPSLSGRDDVLIVACRDAGSLKVAHAYRSLRAVDAENLLILETPSSSEIDYADYEARIEKPIRDRVSGRNIRYVVLCYGVPYRIREERADRGDVLRNRTPVQLASFVTHHDWASVDSELACVLLPKHSRDGWRPNPLFGKPLHSAARVLRVCRLDGPSVADSIALIRRAVESERIGIPRRAMIDLTPMMADREGYGTRNRRMGETGRQLERDGWAVTWENSEYTERRPSRWNAPSIYFGWYAVHADVSDARGTVFPAGAFAMHIHSYSALDIRSGRRHWVGPLVKSGVTGVVGTVAEPLTDGFPLSDRIVRGLMAGGAYGDVVYGALPHLSWVTVVVGDPLWRPKYVD